MATFRRVLITRPRGQGESLTTRLQSRGITTASVPALAIVPLGRAQERQAIKNQIVRLDQFAILIFVSQNAVAFAFDWIEDYWPQFPSGVICLGIGAKTCELLGQRLAPFGIALPESRAMVHMNSEELLAAPCLQQVQDKKILIFRGQGGRTLLFDTLSTRGANVEHCELYERRLPDDARAALAEVQVYPHSDIAVLFSGESLHNFHRLLGDLDIEDWQHLPLLLPSERVDKMARELGFTDTCSAANASEEAMHEALVKRLETT